MISLRLRSLAASALGALALAPSAGAHIDATPPFLPADRTEILSLTGHNDRDVPMTGFAVAAPSGFRIHGASDAGDWRGTEEGATASWTGGRLAPDRKATFRLSVEARPEVGPAELEVRQLYPDGGVVRSRVALTVVPADEASRSSWWILAPVLGGGLLVTGLALALVAKRRHR